MGAAALLESDLEGTRRGRRSLARSLTRSDLDHKNGADSSSSAMAQLQPRAAPAALSRDKGVPPLNSLLASFMLPFIAIK